MLLSDIKILGYENLTHDFPYFILHSCHGHLLVAFSTALQLKRPHHHDDHFGDIKGVNSDNYKLING